LTTFFNAEPILFMKFTELWEMDFPAPTASSAFDCVARTADFPVDWALLEVDWTVDLALLAADFPAETVESVVDFAVCTTAFPPDWTVSAVLCAIDFVPSMPLWTVDLAFLNTDFIVEESFKWQLDYEEVRVVLEDGWSGSLGKMMNPEDEAARSVKPSAFPLHGRLVK
jgi:hypothetical protein